MSAARLAAEQAFSPPPPHGTPTSEPLVVVKRARLRVPVLPAQAAQEAGAPEGGAEAKGPRIFRVESQAGVQAADAADATAASTLPLPAAGVPATSRRQRASAAQRRPGPVLQVFQAPAQPPAATHGGESADLRQALAEVEAVFDAIRRARAFQLRDVECEAAWRDLSAAADQVQRQMRAQLNTPGHAEVLADLGKAAASGRRRPRGTHQRPPR